MHTIGWSITNGKKYLTIPLIFYSSHSIPKSLMKNLKKKTIYPFLSKRKKERTNNVLSA